jgi:hypothetical protein
VVVHHTVEERLDDDVLKKGNARVVSRLQILDRTLAIAETQIRDCPHRWRHDIAVLFERLQLA